MADHLQFAHDVLRMVRHGIAYGHIKARDVEFLYDDGPKRVSVTQLATDAMRGIEQEIAGRAGPPPEDSYPDQTVLHAEGEVGNCLQATVAGILGWPLAAIPHFALMGENHWWDCAQAWLDSQGYWIDYKPTSYAAEGGALMPKCWLSGRSPRGFSHAVIGDSATGQMLHDPHPSRAGLVEVGYTIYFFRKPAAIPVNEGKAGGRWREGGAAMSDGLTCPECGSVRLNVEQTVTGPESVIRRRRCADGHAFVTEEAVCSAEKYNAWQRQHWQSKQQVRGEAPPSCGYFDCAGCEQCKHVSADRVAARRNSEDSDGSLPVHSESSGAAARPATPGIPALDNQTLSASSTGGVESE